MEDCLPYENGLGNSWFMTPLGHKRTKTERLAVIYSDAPGRRVFDLPLQGCPKSLRSGLAVTTMCSTRSRHIAIPDAWRSDCACAER